VTLVVSLGLSRFHPNGEPIYFDKALALASKARVYIYGAGWSEAITNWADDSAFYSYTPNPGVASCSNTISPAVDRACYFSTDASYAVIVWNVYGEDIGMAMAGPLHNMAILSQSTSGGCPDPSDPSCGSLMIGANMTYYNNYHIPQGYQRSVTQNWVIGHLNQLADLGYPTPGFGG
jgi:hypothetical protein